jgi:hypothetical protein
MKMKTANVDYLEKAKKLSIEDEERVLSRMVGKLPKRLQKEKLTKQEALAIQLELEDEQLQEWRGMMEGLKAKSEKLKLRIAEKEAAQLEKIAKKAAAESAKIAKKNAAAQAKLVKKEPVKKAAVKKVESLQANKTIASVNQDELQQQKVVAAPKVSVNKTEPK